MFAEAKGISSSNPCSAGYAEVGTILEKHGLEYVLKRLPPAHQVSNIHLDKESGEFEISYSKSTTVPVSSSRKKIPLTSLIVEKCVKGTLRLKEGGVCGEVEFKEKAVTLSLFGIAKGRLKKVESDASGKITLTVDLVAGWLFTKTIRESFFPDEESVLTLLGKTLHIIPAEVLPDYELPLPSGVS